MLRKNTNMLLAKKQYREAVPIHASKSDALTSLSNSAWCAFCKNPKMRRISHALKISLRIKERATDVVKNALRANPASSLAAAT